MQLAAELESLVREQNARAPNAGRVSSDDSGAKGGRESAFQEATRNGYALT